MDLLSDFKLDPNMKSGLSNEDDDFLQWGTLKFGREVMPRWCHLKLSYHDPNLVQAFGSKITLSIHRIVWFCSAFGIGP